MDTNLSTSVPDDREARACDSCGEVITADANGYWVGADETSDCPREPIQGHTYLDTVNEGELP